MVSIDRQNWSEIFYYEDETEPSKESGIFASHVEPQSFTHIDEAAEGPIRPKRSVNLIRNRLKFFLKLIEVKKDNRNFEKIGSFDPASQDGCGANGTLAKVFQPTEPNQISQCKDNDGYTQLDTFDDLDRQIIESKTRKKRSGNSNSGG